MLISELSPGWHKEQGLRVNVGRDEIVIEYNPRSESLFSKVSDKGVLVHYGLTPEGATVIRRAVFPKSTYRTSSLRELVSRFRERVAGCPVCSSTSETMGQVFEKKEEMKDMPFALYGWLTGAALLGEVIPIASEYFDEMVRQKMGATPETLPLWARPSLWIGALTGVGGIILGWKVFEYKSTGYYASVTLAATAFATTLLKLVFDLKARSDAGVALLFPEQVAGAGVSPAFRKKQQRLAGLKEEIAQTKQGFRGEPPATPWAEGIIERPWGTSAYDFEVAGKEVGRL